MEDLFLQSSRAKLRFNLGNNGMSSLTVEDLWEVDINLLDKYYSDLHKSLENQESLSLLKPKKEDKAMRLRLEIVRFVIQTRIAEQEAKTLANAKAKEKAVLRDLIARKEVEKLENLPLEELHKLLNSDD